MLGPLNWLFFFFMKDREGKKKKIILLWKILITVIAGLGYAFLRFLYDLHFELKFCSSQHTSQQSGAYRNGLIDSPFKHAYKTFCLCSFLSYTFHGVSHIPINKAYLSLLIHFLRSLRAWKCILIQNNWNILKVAALL